MVVASVINHHKYFPHWSATESVISFFFSFRRSWTIERAVAPTYIIDAIRKSSMDYR